MLTDIRLSSSQGVTFTVQANSNAHIGFFSAAQTTDEVYDIAIGGWGNTRSAIREQSGGVTQVQIDTPGIVSDTEARQFWADAVNGLIRFGSSATIGSEIIMQWQDPDPHHTAAYVGVKTGWGSTGEWHVCEAGSQHEEKTCCANCLRCQ